MQTNPCPSCGRRDGRHSHVRPGIGYQPGAEAHKCSICSGPLADHTISDHASRVAERLAALGFPTPVDVGMP